MLNLQESVFSFPASSQSTVEEEEHSCTTEVVDEEPRAAEAPLSCPSDTSFRLQTSGQTSCTSRDDEEGSASVQGEVDDHEDFLAQFTEQVSSEHQRTSDRPEDVGSHTEESPEQQINKAQRLVSPETDSGFSTSDMSRPPTGLSHTPCNPESSSPSDDVNSMSSMSASDNEAFHSNLHTVIPWAGWSKMGESEPDPLPNYAQNMQENYTTQNSPAGLHIAGEAPLCSREGATLHTAQLQEPSQEEHSVNIQRPTASETPTRDKQSPCSCPNNEAISALRYEVSRLKKVLEESLGYLPHLSMRMDHLSNMYTQEKRLRSRTRLRHQHRPPSKGTDSGESDHSERPVSFSPTYIHYHSRPSSSTRLHDLKCSSTAASLESLSQDRSQSKPRNNHRRASVEPSSPGCSVSIGPSSHSSDVSIGPVSYNRRASVGYTRHSSKVSIESTTSGSRTSAGAVSHGYRPPGENVCLKDRYLSPHLLHKPLLQTGYGSCNSLPPSFKVRDQQSDSEVSSRRRTTQSDSAMLPSNVYFQRTSPLPASACRTRGRPWRQKISKCGQEEAINRSLDKALEAALLMKQTTDRMAKTLSTDLAKTRTYRKLHGIHPEQPRLERSPALNVHHTLH
ncbi:uncharacterized protein [Salminus brasiliensis]|uniref:uncharacterized protein n=1 Tax=Salminus brasiliensis TaxID=930266 RepID=UPI003B839270